VRAILALTLIAAVACVTAADPPDDASVSDKTVTIDTPLDPTFGRIFTLGDCEGNRIGHEVIISGQLGGFDFRASPSKVLLAIADDSETICMGMAEVRADGSFRGRCGITSDSPAPYQDRLVRLHVTVHDGKDWRESFKFCGMVRVKP
jgi:hypothetical protein